LEIRDMLRQSSVSLVGESANALVLEGGYDGIRSRSFTSSAFAIFTSVSIDGEFVSLSIRDI
jgi:hypothetical protein